MRQWIALFESNTPQHLYHGTSDEAWESIQETNSMMAMEYENMTGGTIKMDAPGICFTASERVAITFAQQAAIDGMAEKGIVIVFDAQKLADRFSLTPYHDARMSGNWQFFLDEEEWRINATKIEGILDCVVGTHDVSTESPEAHEQKSKSEIISQAVKEVRNAYSPNFQGACEGAVGDLAEILTANNIPHRVVEGRYLHPMQWGDGTTHPFTPHWWIEVGDFILDPTREQFGSSNLISNKQHRDGALYQHGGVGHA